MLRGLDYSAGFKPQVEIFCDVVVTFRQEKFKTHAVVLVLNSNFIANLLFDMKDKIASGRNQQLLQELPVTELFKDYDEEDVEQLLCHFYDDSLAISSMKEALHMRDMAHRLDAQHLYEKTSDYIKLNMQNTEVDKDCDDENSLLWCLRFCANHGQEDLQIQFERIACERIKDVLLLDADRLRQLPSQNLVRLLLGVATIAHKENARVHNFMTGLRSCAHCRQVQSNGYSTCIGCGLLKYTGNFNLSQVEYEAGLQTFNLIDANQRQINVDNLEEVEDALLEDLSALEIQ